MDSFKPGQICILTGKKHRFSNSGEAAPALYRQANAVFSVKNGLKSIRGKIPAE
jgi:hypothetical protein